MLNHPIQFVYGSYENIKITTPEDLEVAEVFVTKNIKLVLTSLDTWIMIMVE